MMLPQKLFVYTWFIIIPFDICTGYKAYEIAVPHLIFCQKNQMVIAYAIDFGALMSASGCKIDLTADDGADSLLLRLLIKCNRTVHCTMVCYGNRVHP